MLSGKLQAHGDLSDRIAELRKEVAQHPGDGERQLTLAGTLSQNGDFAAALAVLDGLEQTAPGKFCTGKLRGSVLLALNRPGEARTALDRFLAQYPGDSAAVLYRARALTALSLTEAGLTDYREALHCAAAPEPDLFQEVSTAMAAAGCQDEALAVLNQGLKALGPIPSLTQRALDLEVTLKRFDAALARVEEMQRKAPRPEQWMAKRAAILTSAGRINESRETWQTLISHLETLPPAARGSNAMCRMAEEARHGLNGLRGLSVLEARPTAPAALSPQRIHAPTKL
jgi:predicted Zn-dependent protease